MLLPRPRSWRRYLSTTAFTRGQERGYNYYPFQDMFRPFEPALTRFKSLVMFTAGRSGMANVDALITAWGLKNFDYVLMLFDDSNSEWSRCARGGRGPFR